MTLNPELKNEIASIERDPLAPMYGGIMRSADDTLLSRGQGKGLDIYDDIERDCHAYAVIQKRKMSVTSREWVVEPASTKRQDKAAAELVRAQLAELGFDQVCLGLLDAILKGYAVGEVMWAVRDGMIVVDDVRARKQRRFVFTTDSELRMLVPENLVDGVALPDRKFIVHRFGAKDGNPYGLGLGHKLFWPVFFKRQDLAFWLTFTDKFASPTVVGKYQASASTEDRRKLLAATQAVSREAGVIIPEGMLLELMEAARSGSVDAYEKLARYMDEQISEAVLGETLTTTQGAGSRAASQTHNEVREELSKADADVLSDTLNRTLVRWIVELNMPGARPPKVWRIFEEPEDLKARAERDRILYGMGYKPTPEYVQATYGEGWVPRESTPGDHSGGANGMITRPPAAEFAEGDDADVAMAYADQAGERAPGAMDPLVAPIRDLVEKAGSLEEVRDQLLELYPEMDAAGFTDLMGEALTASHLAGRFEVQDGR